MKINKLICDQCGEEHDLTQMYFGGRNEWQEINEVGEHNETITKHFCCINCLTDYLISKRPA